jgi:putative tricarboxylic transport membrane protein
VLLIIASLAAYAALLDVLGFLIATVPLMLVLLRGIDPVRWRTALLIALLATLGVWWVLKRLLLIQLPVGIFEIG